MKRKVILISLLLVIILGLLNIVQADYGSPEIIDYEAVIINKNGSKAKGLNRGDEDTIIPYNTKVLVFMEVWGDNRTTGAYVTYNNVNYEINLDDIKPIEKTDSLLDKAEDRLLSNPMYVFRKGAYLYEGPSIKYDIMKDSNGNPIEIPIGTTVEFEACSEAWGYTEYNGVKGWVFICTAPKQSAYVDFDCALANIPEEIHSYLYTMKKITLYDEPGSNKVTGTIPAYTTVHYLYSVAYPDPHYSAVYIETDNAKGWYQVELDEVMNDYSKLSKNVLIFNDIDIYEKVDLNSGKSSNKITTIPAGEKPILLAFVQNEYENYSCVYIEYEGQKGFFVEDSYDMDKIMLPSNITYLSEPFYLTDDAEILDIKSFRPTGEYFSKGAKIENLYESYPYYYVTDGKKEGLVDISKMSYKYAAELEEDEVSMITSESKTDDTDLTNEVKPEEESKELNAVKKDSIDNLAICSFIALIVLFIIFVKLKLSVNKDKNNQG